MKKQIKHNSEFFPSFNEWLLEKYGVTSDDMTDDDYDYYYSLYEKYKDKGDTTMKKYKSIKASRSLGDPILVSENGNFELAEQHGIGMKDTPYKQLVVVRSSLAEEYVVDVRLSSVWQNFEGDPVTYKYTGDVSVAHGMRARVETLEETEQYIQLLSEALDFAYEVQDYLNNSPDWRMLR